MNSKFLALLPFAFLVVACAPAGNETQTTPEASISEPQNVVNVPAPASAPVSASVPASAPAPAPAAASAPAPVSASAPVVNTSPAAELPPDDFGDDVFQVAEVNEPAKLPPPQPSRIQDTVNSTPDSGASVPVPVPRPRPAAAPAAKPTAASSEMDALQKQLLDLINQSRASRGVVPVKFHVVESQGTGRCPGSLGHSMHMAQTHNMSHDQFPADICVRTRSSGENVGYAGGSPSQALRQIHKMMMDEGPSGGHYQNIMSASYNRVGLGLYYSNGTLWLTEDFLLE